jgi:small subunit ribosomal protein S9
MVKTKVEKQDSFAKKAEKRFYYGTGRRKTAVAKVFLYEDGSGKIIVNGKKYEEYFVTVDERNAAVKPLKVTNIESNKYDIIVKVLGGGLQSQAEAMSLGLARALKLAIPDTEQVLKQNKLLTRDPRMKERKHYGYRGARRRPQWTKR